MQSSLRKLPSLTISKIPLQNTTPQLISCFSTQTPKMSVFFPRFTEIHPIFRLADEIEKATRHQQANTFTPRFDVQETKETYELLGELPGVDQENVNIEWTDEHTLAISGQTQSRRCSPKTLTEEKTAPEATEAAEDPSSEKYEKPSVEDEDGVVVESPNAGEQKTESSETATKAPEEPRKCKPRARYWVAERSYGSFRRTFHFPGRVDHDAIKAGLKNGVLSITIPKAKALEPKKVTIN